MSGGVFVSVFVAIPLVLALLDLADRHAMRPRGDDGDGFRPATVVFLLAVLLLYWTLQYGLFALAPSMNALTERTQEAFGRWLGQSPEPRPPAGPWTLVLVVVLFYAAGLCDYLMHRFVSHHPWMWFTHEYHHLPSQVFVLAPGIAARPFSIVSTLPVAAATVVFGYALLALLGLPLYDLASLQGLVLLQAFVLTSSHSSCLRRWWWVHHTLKCLGITTPQEHVLHHTTDLRGNYGNFTTLWDRLFGTYLDPARPENQGRALGLPYDQDFLGAITLGKVKLPRRLRRWARVGNYCNVRDETPPSVPEQIAPKETS
jgi:sterol desaturase/sphingolipid hydroxylase (fatty acid hydroxylase superfamily)